MNCNTTHYRANSSSVPGDPTINKHPYVYGKHYIPHDAKQRMQAAEVITKERELRKLGLHNLKTVPVTPTKNLAIDQLRTFLLTCEFDAEGCADGIKCLDAYQREWDPKLLRWGNAPLHNWASHGADALMQGAQGYNPDRDRRLPVLEDRVLEPEVGY